MSRGMNHLNRILSYSYQFSVREKLIHFRWWRDAETHELADAALHRLEHGKIVTMDQKRNLERVTNRLHPQHMIEVRMSRNDQAGLDSDVAEEAKNSFRFVARVNDQRHRIRLYDVAVGL